MFSKFSPGYVLKPQDPATNRTDEETDQLISFINENVVGRNETFVGPFGRRKVVYCDYAASARAMHFIEEFILNDVLPLYGNIHTSTSVTSMQSSLFREESRDILCQAVNASDKDVVLFTGHGCTGAIRKLITCLNIPPEPIVFFGPCEHHSHLVPWQEIGATIVRISETKEGMLDLTDLENKLTLYQTSNKTLIGCFSAASSTTGILADDIATTLLLHQYKALAFWDYGTAAPYVHLDMNPLVPGIDKSGAYKDAMFFSSHKFIGGVQSPGILVAKKSLFNNVSPQGCAGVPAFFLTHEDVYLKDTELFEETGTAAIVESVRAGIAMKVKQTVGVSAIMDREAKIVKTACSFFRKIPEIILLGSTTQVDRLAIFSIMVRHPRGAYLHHNYICAVLNDVFGIQTRGGCSCSAPYARDLMGINKTLASDLEAVLQEDCESCDHQQTTQNQQEKKDSNYEMLRPGFVRISFPYFMSESEIAFVLEAIKMVATEGWKLLPQYVLNPETGEWRHHSNTVFKERKWLNNIRYKDGKLTTAERKLSCAGPYPVDFNDCLRLARSTFNKARKMARRHPVADTCTLLHDNEVSPIRWFMIPSEAQDLLLGRSSNVKQEVPFSPTAYKGSKPPPDPHENQLKKALSTPDTTELILSDSKIIRQRSESSSPAREEKDILRCKASLLRDRCYSLSSSFAPHSHSCRLQPFSRQRLLSCGSAPENTDSEASISGDVDFSSGSPPNLRNTPDLVYVEGITKELATEIKSELRGVIAQVEDVLSENNDTDYYNNHNADKKSNIEYQNFFKRKAFSLPISVNSEEQNNDHSQNMKQYNLLNSQSSPKPCCAHSNLPATISAERFSEYLVGFTSDVVSEMKSEFRDVVNAVDGLISPSPIAPEGKPKEELKDSIEKEPIQKSPSIQIIDAKKDKKGFNHWKNMLSSQDSGINLTDRDLSPSEICERKKNNSFCDSEEKDTDSEQMANEEVPLPECFWHLPPKNIWNPTCEAIKEFDMIQNGDRILVCLKNQKESMSLLHTLRQYQYYSASKGKQFQLAATADSSSKYLLEYLKNLDIDLILQDDLHDGSLQEPSILASQAMKGKLCSLAKEHNCNVIALGQNLDDISESFLMSVFHNGYLQTKKAKYIIVKENLRVIRPFVYVREHSIKKFAETAEFRAFGCQKTPGAFEKLKERNRIKHLLAEQEIIFPKLFFSLKSAIKPLLTGCFDMDKVKKRGEENL